MFSRCRLVDFSALFVFVYGFYGGNLVASFEISDHRDVLVHEESGFKLMRKISYKSYGSYKSAESELIWFK